MLADHGSVADRAALEEAVNGAGRRLVVADVAVDDGSPRHDPGKLAAAYDAIVRPRLTVEHLRGTVTIRREGR